MVLVRKNITIDELKNSFSPFKKKPINYTLVIYYWVQQI